MYIGRNDIAVPVYGLMVLTGIVAGVIAGIRLVKKNGLLVDDFILLAAYAVLGGFTGAKFLYLWVSRDAIQWEQMLNLSYFRAVMSGGFVFYGGLFGGFLGLASGAWIHGIQARRYLYVCIPILPLAHAFGRLGCGAAGCCYGIPYQGPFQIVYRHAAAAPVGIPLFPVQYLEAFIEFLLAAVLFRMVSQKGGTCRGVELYLLVYSMTRFLLEFLRYDRVERGAWKNLSTSQWISLGIFIAAALSILYIEVKSSAGERGKRYG